MKKTLFFVAALFGFVSAGADNVMIQTPNTTMVVKADKGKELRQAYYGDRISDAEAGQLAEAGIDLNTAVYPTFGQTDMVQLSALQVLHPDGQLVLYPTVDEVSTTKEGNGSVTAITMTDKKYPVTVKVFYKSYSSCDIIETWTEISHREKKAIRLQRFDSGHLAFPQGNAWMMHFHGDWSAEFYPTTEPITQGLKTIRNSDGDRNTHLDAPEIMISLDGKPQENAGKVIGAALCWSGNFELRINTTLNKMHHFYAGISPQAAEYILEPGETFTTPRLALCMSSEGLGGVSRNFHRWARHEGWLHQGDKTREILLNSWEDT